MSHSMNKPGIKIPADLFCILHPDGHILASSRAWQAMLCDGKNPQPPVRIQDLLMPDRKNHWPRILDKLSKHPSTSAILAFRATDGKVRYLLSHFAPAAPALHGAVRAVFRDVTAGHMARTTCRQSLQAMLRMATASQGAFALLDFRGRICHWSGGAEALFGYSRKQALRKTLHDVLAPRCKPPGKERDDAPIFPAEYTDLQQDFDRVVCCREDGTTVDVSLCLSPIATGHRRYTAALFLERKKSQVREEKHIEYLAYYDQLTGLPNRTLLQERLQQSLAEASRFEHPLAVLFVDLDRFKQINDSYGHAIGDRVLKIAAQRLQECLRGNDTVARLGGDEFIIVLSGFREQGNLPKILHKIFANLSREYPIDGHRLRITASVGISVFPGDGETADRLLRNADTAMYVAKEDHGNSYRLFSEEMNRALMAQLELEEHLRRAVGNREFFLLFQPRFDLASRRTVGIEALVRWRHPDGRVCVPRLFLPRLEDMGLMVSLGRRILYKACEIANALQRPGRPPMPVAVNLSASQFRHSELIHTVAGILKETGLPPGCLELEIEEPTLQKNEDRAGTILQNIKQLGVRCSLDNFGLGYTSLQRLKNLPFDYLKIDRHFVRNLPGNQNDAAMVGAILGMARNLGLTSVAEGIENFAQYHLLLAMGCSYGQGYFFQEPCFPDALKNALHPEPDIPIVSRHLHAVSAS